MSTPATESDITIVGLGPAGLDWLTGESMRRLMSAERLLLRTERHPAAQELKARGVQYESLDAHYDLCTDFSQLYPQLSEAVLARCEQGAVTYAVPGHPLLGEESVRLVLERARECGKTVRVLPGMSFIDVVAPALAAAGETPDLTEWQVADGTALERVWWDVTRPVLVFQIDDEEVASRVKLAALEEYPPDHEVCIVRHAGVIGGETVRRVPLSDMDHPGAGRYDHLTTVYLPPLPADQKCPGFQEFVELVATLRSPEGCPWDREQTPQTLKRFVLEEAYEVLEAVDSGDPERLCDELGDLMLQVLMYAQFGAEDGYFDIRDVMANTVEKLVRRHPHVFGDVDAADSDTVLKNWEAIKREERPERKSVLDGVPRDLPALMKALDVSKRAVKVGFEWPTLDAVFEKLDEEIGELKAEIDGADRDRLSAEIGDLLFTVVNVARWLKVDPEEALRQMVERFGRRFREVERLAGDQGRELRSMGIEELDRLWNEAKRAEVTPERSRDR